MMTNSPPKHSNGGPRWATVRPATRPFARVALHVSVGLYVCALSSSAATFSVTSTNGSGPGSLRQAILDANASAGADTIAFGIPSGGLTIQLTNALPAITEALAVDGTSQPGYAGAPLIELSGQFGTNGMDGVRIEAGPVILRALLINRFKADGVKIAGGSGHVIEGCTIGLDAAGSDQGNTLSGVSITNGTDIVIGGPGVEQRNVISGNTQNGIYLGGLAVSNVLIRGNTIGLNRTGDTSRPNSQQGIYVNGSPGNTIGGVGPGEGNLISGNSQSGVRIEGTNAHRNTVVGNRVGLDAAGLIARANGSGVHLLNASNNVVGGSGTGAGNLISGNSGDGVRVEGASARVNTILGNVIGMDRSGNTARPNSGAGIHFLASASGNRAGGTNPGEGNTLWFNGGDGIHFEAGTNNVGRGNSIFGNAGLGHDVGINGVTANDALDTDSGANQLQNFPLLTSATNLASSLFISGTLDSRSNGVYEVDFYSSPERDPTTNGEGQVYLGSTSVTTDSAGSAAFSLILPRQAFGRFLCATAVDTNGNTSEFSPAIPVSTSLPAQTFTVINTDDSGPGSLRQAILDANGAVTGTNDLVHFAIPDVGPHAIVPVSPLPALIDPVTVDGFTQAGAGANTSAETNNAVWQIRLLGTNLPAGADGLLVATSGCVVRGLVIAGFRGDGIEIGTNRFSRIEGNLIGLDLVESDAGNGGHGVNVNQSAENTIGGDTPASRNVISRNGQHGVLLTGAGSSNNVVAGNLIGTSPDGTGDQGNGSDGIQINNASGNWIGGQGVSLANVIAGNNNDGIELNGAGASNNVVAGNRIGLDALGGALGNGAAGIRFASNARSNAVGVAVATGANWIQNNGGGGVEINTGTNNTVRANRIFANGGLGLDLGGGGSVLANDAGDADAGPNQGQNHPVIDFGQVTAGATTIRGTLNSRPLLEYTLDIYASTDPDASGFGEGQAWLGSTTATTAGDGTAVFDVTLPVEAPGRILTATATDPSGNTSEFGPALPALSGLTGVTFTVANTNDSGAGSLRQAILDANAAFNAGDRIEFSIPGNGPHTIAPATALPTITDTVVIDGFTQPGSHANTLAEGNDAVVRIQLDGAAAQGFAVDGLRVQSNNCEIRGLCITRFGGDGVQISGGSSNVVAGCLIGIGLDGTAQRNSNDGVRIVQAAANRIGGTHAADRNVLSGNFGGGIRFEGVGSSNGVVQGNFIGTGLAGTNAVPNFGNGVLVDASGVLIGGSVPGARNVISGNFAPAIETRYESPEGLLVLGNFIGTDVTGKAAIPNQQGGVSFGAGSGHRVGGALPEERNLISGNLNTPISISSLSGGRCIVLGNWIGLNRDGLPLTNLSTAIYITGNSNRIGGVSPGEGNVIAYNRDGGIYVPMGTANTIRGNRVFANNTRFTSGLGIDLGPGGVTLNDPGDADTGANGLQNFPVLIEAAMEATATRIRGTLTSAAAGTFNVDFYSNRVPDPLGYGEGETFLGSTTVSTDAAGDAPFDVTLPVAAEGRFITAVATDAAGNSSEFSAARAASSLLPAQTFTVVNTNDAGPGSLRQAILDAGQHVAASNNLIAFAIPGAGPHVIQIATVLPTPIEPVTIDGFTQPGSAPNTAAEADTAIRPVILEGSRLGFNSQGLLLSQSGSRIRGLEIAGFYNGLMVAGVSNVVVEGCLIRSNLNYGLFLSNAVATVVGGVDAAARNRISGQSGGYGLYLLGPACQDNLILGNLVGPGATGTQPEGRQYHGIVLQDADRNRIGGVAPGEANVIAFNEAAGFLNLFGTNNPVRGNRIFDNGGLGIDLEYSGVTPNDGDDSDEGPNRLQNFPLLDSADAAAGATDIRGSLQSRPNAVFTLDFYSSVQRDFSDHGEGEFFLGSAQVNTDAAGLANFSVSLPTTVQGNFLSATATDADGNTSEFSPVIEPTFALPGRTYTVTSAADSGPGTLRQALLDVDLFANVTPDQIAFAIPGPGVKLISPLTPLPVPQFPVNIDGLTQPGAAANTSTNEHNAMLLIQIDGAAMTGGGYGLELVAAGNTIRGLSLTRFASTALHLAGSGSNVVEACRIGVTPSGQPGTNEAGLALWSPNNRVGGVAPAARNLIAGNEDYGVVIAGNTASNNVVVGNFIGLIGPTNGLGHGRDGVVISQASHNRIGGTLAEGNLIGFSERAGVNVQSGEDNLIQGNTFFSNGSGSIALSPDANGGIQPPVLSAALLGSVTVRGTYQGQPNTRYELEAYFYESHWMVNGKIEDSYWPLGRFEVLTGADGRADYDHTFDDAFPAAGGYVHVTATGPGQGTSEPSALVPLFPSDAVDVGLQVTGPYQVPPNTPFALTLTCLNAGPTTADDVQVMVLTPPGTDLLDITGGGDVTLVDGTGIVDFTSLAVGASVPLTVRASSPIEGTLPITATIGARQPDARPRNNLGSWELRLTVAGLSTFADVQIEFPDHPDGGSIPGNADLPTQFRVRVTNHGPGVATDIDADICHLFGFSPSTSDLDATAPAGTTYTVSADRDLVRWQIPTLGVGQALDLDLQALWRTDSRSSTNRNQVQAVVQSASTDPLLENNVASIDCILPTAHPQLSIESDSEPGIFNIVITDAGPDTTVVSSTTLNRPIGTWDPVAPERIVRTGNTQTIRIVGADPRTPSSEFFSTESANASAPRMEIDQVSLSLDRRVFLKDTDYGQATLSFLGSDTPGYFSLWHGATAVLTDVPLLSPNGAGVPHDMIFNFPISPFGTEVTSGDFGFRISDTPGQAGLPPLTTMPVQPIVLTLGSGETDGGVFYFPASYATGAVVQVSARNQPVFPNREQGLNECVPSALANSLEYLNTRYSLGMDTNQISVAKLKEVIGWQPHGAPVGDDPSDPLWAQRKKNHLAEQSLPVTTQVTADPAQAMQALGDSCNVEIRVTGHAACLRAMARMDATRYVLVISHDQQQGQPGGTILETLLYDSATGAITGGLWTQGRQLTAFVIECPLPP